MKQDDAVKNYIEENLPFVAALNTSIKDETKIDQIIFPSSRKKGYDDVNLPASIEQMLNDDKTDLGTFNGITYTPYKLAIDLSVIYLFL